MVALTGGQAVPPQQLRVCAVIVVTRVSAALPGATKLF
jgi:hypothetical protein